MATKFSLNIFRLLKDGSDVSFLYFLGSVMGWTIETRCLFRRFSIVLPKILLFMSLKKSFSKSFFALARRAVFYFYIWLHSGRLIKLNSLINMFQYHSLTNIVLEISVVDDIFIFIEKIRDELFCEHIFLTGTLD